MGEKSPSTRLVVGITVTRPAENFSKSLNRDPQRDNDCESAFQVLD
jgi:hypothetical protein